MNMQIDDIFILADQSFAVVEEEAIHSIKIMTKTREQLTLENALKFNDTRIERIESNDVIYFKQEKHIQDIQLIKIEFIIIISVRDKIRAMLISKKQYIAQRVRETYLISICQSETSFDLFRAAQSTEIISDNIISLNKRLN
jgi:alpha-glucuronidase